MKGIVLKAGDLDRRIRFERPVASVDFDGGGSGTWEAVATVWANIRDVRPTNSEHVAGNVSMAARPARIWLRYRADITPDMRIIHGDRIMQIVSQPAEIGRRQGIELLAQDFSTHGNPA